MGHNDQVKSLLVGFVQQRVLEGSLNEALKFGWRGVVRDHAAKFEAIATEAVDSADEVDVFMDEAVSDVVHEVLAELG